MSETKSVKTYAEIKKHIKESVKKNKNGNTIKTFSMKDFNSLSKGLLNDKDHTVEVCSLKDGKKVVEKVKPVEELRNNFVKKIVKDAGLDMKDAEEFVKNYEFTNVNGLYPFVSTLITEYLDAGKKFDFLPTEDFKGSLIFKKIPKNTATRKNIKTQEEFKVETKDYTALRIKNGGAPAWLKKRV